MLLWLLTAARISEVAQAKSAEYVNGVWTIPSPRVKNSFAHNIALGPWGRSLILSNHEWVFPAPRIDGPRNNSVWYKARDRVRARMAVMARHPIERFKAVATPNSVASARKGAAASFTGSDRSLKRSSSRSAQRSE